MIPGPKAILSSPCPEQSSLARPRLRRPSGFPGKRGQTPGIFYSTIILPSRKLPACGRHRFERRFDMAGRRSRHSTIVRSRFRRDSPRYPQVGHQVWFAVSMLRVTTKGGSVPEEPRWKCSEATSATFVLFLVAAELRRLRPISSYHRIAFFASVAYLPVWFATVACCLFQLLRWLGGD